MSDPGIEKKRIWYWWNKSYRWVFWQRFLNGGDNMPGIVYNEFEVMTDLEDVIEDINKKIDFPKEEEFTNVDIYVDGKLFLRTYAMGMKLKSYNTKNGKTKYYLSFLEVNHNIKPDPDEDEWEDDEKSNVGSLLDFYFNDMGLKPDFVHLFSGEEYLSSSLALYFKS